MKLNPMQLRKTTPAHPRPSAYTDTHLRTTPTRTTRPRAHTPKSRLLNTHALTLLPLLLTLLLPLTLLAQKPVRLAAQLEAVGTGTATLTYDPLHLGHPETVQSVEAPMESGKLALEVKLTQPTPAELTVAGKQIPLWLEPGDELTLHVDAAGKTAFAGANAHHSDFLQRFQERYGRFHDTAAMRTRVLDEPIDPLELDLFDTRKAQQAMLTQAFAQNTYTEAFKAYIEAEVAYNYDRWLLAYPILRANARPRELEVQNLPGTIEEGFDPARLNNPKALVSPAYREYVYYYVSYFAAKENNYQKFKDQTTALNAKSLYASTRLTGLPATWFNSHLLLTYKAGAAPGHVERIIAAIQKGEQGPGYAKAVQTALAAHAAAAKANPQENDPNATTKNPSAASASPDERYPIRMIGLDGKPVHLSDFKGKVVYIDFWASWCGPCRQQFPHSKTLKETLHTRLTKKQQKEVVFLYISIDQDEAAWKKAITDLGIEGTHAYSNAKWPDGAGTYFQVAGIPRYMIMDKTGEIVVRNAKRPSMEGVLDEILQYLQ